MENSFSYQPAADRYEQMPYTYCGKSGLQLPLISLGLWHNFGSVDNFNVATDMIKYAFDHGVTHFDLANNYGPAPGSAEVNFGRILKENFQGYRDEMIISSKAGHDMWAGPYGGNSSRKNLMASIDQSLCRTGLEYFDIFYSHRYDGVTPVEETIQTLIDIVKQGKALYIGISKYPPEQARVAYEMMAKAGVPCLISQYRYSMFDRAVEAESLPLAAEYGSGFIAFGVVCGTFGTDTTDVFGAIKYREAMAFQYIHQFHELHTETQVGFVATIIFHGVRPCHTLELTFQFHTADFFEQIFRHTFKQVDDVVLFYERHFAVYLSKFRLTVGTKVLVTETLGNLEVTVKTGYHQQLLQGLRALRQGVKLSRIHA